MSLAATLASRLSSLPSHRAPPQDDAASVMSEDAIPSLAASSLSSSFDARSCHSEPASSADASSSIPRPRRNEHLAVLLPKRLWKPDSQAAHCDTFLCRKPFSIWERRHHCRKCGGVFCAECSSKTTRLLDTSTLSFLNPPRNVPIDIYDSPTSPVVDSRVCDDCHDQIHGSKSPRSPVIARSNPIQLVRSTDSSTASGSSSVSSSVSTPPDGSPLNSIAARPTFRRTHTSPRIPASPLRSSTPVPSGSVHIMDSELSLGELDSYPLKRASNICKASGGGRWEPKPIPQYVARRIPGRKAEYELELEREEAERRLRRANPVIKHGDFQLRAPREMEPRSPAGPFTLSTF
ncbi:hypothetical protein OH76DRAFT_1481391 [Lentinus brumalis]|uniref:FYVE-type domain-containing protein n=1 Tax=Lentinus brumalis TaxID=2498619 RepID=A0A371DG00_9APHY|nr:hypothetical protein OH76DRAFT_1481391 [Polyporus brumalis]